MRVVRVVAGQAGAGNVMRALTTRQPWASLIIAGLKDVENRTWPVPKTLPQQYRCYACGEYEGHHDNVVCETPSPVAVDSFQWERCDRCGRRSRDGKPEQGPGNGVHYTDACTPELGLVGNLVADGPFPFRLAIHAGKRHDGNEFRRALLRATAVMGEGEPGNTMEWIRGWWGNRDAIGGYGALIGTVTVTGCHHADECAQDDTNDFPLHIGETRTIWRKRYCSRWAEPNAYHWTLADPVELGEPVPMRGLQRLWTVPDGVIA